MVKTLKEELLEYKDKYLRALAEISNYRKQVVKEKELLSENIKENIIKNFLPIADDFDRCFSLLDTAKENESLSGFRKGIELIYENFKKVLESLGVKSYNSLGEKFDPYLHEVVEVIVSDKDENIIVKEITKGYKLNDKVIRPAKVVVNKRE